MYAVSLMASALVAAWVAIILLALALGVLVRTVKEMRVAGVAEAMPFGGPPVGSRLPAHLRTPGSPTAVLFVSPGCTACDLLRTKLPTLIAPLDPPLAITLVLTGSAVATEREAASYKVVEGDALLERHRIRATPFGVLVDPDGRVVLSEPLGSVEALEELVDTIAMTEVVR